MRAARIDGQPQTQLPAAGDCGKDHRLSQLLTESFRFLLRKKSLVEQVAIEPQSFAITLYAQAVTAIPKQRRSEGEKQIFAISVLWGLSRAAARPLPAIIDTPMARLDPRRSATPKGVPQQSEGLAENRLPLGAADRVPRTLKRFHETRDWHVCNPCGVDDHGCGDRHRG